MYIMLNMNYPSSFKEFNEVLKSLNANVNGKQLELIQEQWKKPCHGFHSHYTGANMRKKIYNDRVDFNNNDKLVHAIHLLSIKMA